MGGQCYHTDDDSHTERHNDHRYILDITFGVRHSVESPILTFVYSIFLFIVVVEYIAGRGMQSQSR